MVSLNNYTETNLIKGFLGAVSVNGKVDNDVSGPDGLLLLSDRDELYVGDGDGSIKVIDLLSNTIVANISTGSKKRADEMAYDPKSGLMVVTSPAEDTPEVTVISVRNRTVLGHVTFANASGLEQPAFNTVDGRFYISVPSNGMYPGGDIAVLDIPSMSVFKNLPVPQCEPAGIVFGPNQHLFIGCSQTQIIDYGHADSLVMDTATGSIIANISGITGIDQVTYDSATNFYFASAYQNLVGGLKSGAPMPQLAIINASDNTLIQTITTDNVTAHSVAVDAKTGTMIVPVSMKGLEVFHLNSAASNSTPNATAPASFTSGGMIKADAGFVEILMGFAFAGAALFSGIMLF